MRALPRNGLPVLLACVALLVPGASLRAQTTLRASVSSQGIQAGSESFHAVLSGDGRFVAFQSTGPGLVPEDTNSSFVRDVFVRDRVTGTTEIVSVDSNGVGSPNDSIWPAISRDGRFVALASHYTFALPDAGFESDVFVRDLQTGTTERVSVASGGGEGTGGSSFPALSADGRYVAFWSQANDLVLADPNGATDVFVHDRLTGTTEQASLPAPGGNAVGFTDALPSISADGRFVVFSTLAPLAPGDTNLKFDVYLRDRALATTTRVSLGNAGDQVLRDCTLATVSDDGRFVAFSSAAATLVADDGNGRGDVFVRDVLLGTTTLVSANPAGDSANGSSDDPVLSGDGRWVAFRSSAPDLDGRDTSSDADVFLRDLVSGTTALVSVDEAGVHVFNAQSHRPSITPDGLRVGFDSLGALVEPDTNDKRDAYVRDFTLSCPPGALYCALKTNSLGCSPRIAYSGVPTLSGSDAFQVGASLLISGQLGMLVWSHGQASTPFAGGTLCVAAPFVRTAAQNTGGSATLSCSGTLSFLFSPSYMTAQGWAAGTTVHAQSWARDPGFTAPDNVQLTPGASFTVCP